MDATGISRSRGSHNQRCYLLLLFVRQAANGADVSFVLGAMPHCQRGSTIRVLHQDPKSSLPEGFSTAFSA